MTRSAVKRPVEKNCDKAGEDGDSVARGGGEGGEEVLLMISSAIGSDPHYTLSHLVAMEQAEAGVHDGIRRVVVP